MDVDTTRFTGFADLYDLVRPRPPAKAVDLVLSYLRQSRAGSVVDLGSGTGLSTALWVGRADRIVGIEPTADMRRQAQDRHPDLVFRDGNSYATGLADGWADVVTCSQSFHWMEPTATLAEVARLLRPGGVFAAYDCRWPVTWDWEAEAAYHTLYRRIADLLVRRPELAEEDRAFPKHRHRANLEASGRFSFVTELVFDSQEPCDARRFVDIVLSQGHIQTLIKRGVVELQEPLEEFRRVCAKSRADTMRVGYQMVIGIA